MGLGYTKAAMECGRTRVGHRGCPRAVRSTVVPITHTNAKGKTYYLHQGTTKTGKPKYHFSMESNGALAGPNWEIYGDWTDNPDELRTEVFYLLQESEQHTLDQSHGSTEQLSNRTGNVEVRAGLGTNGLHRHYQW